MPFRFKSPLFLAAAAFAIFAGIVYLYNVDPHKPDGYPSCPFYALTGKCCPGCGSLRAVFCILHGHIAAAATRNILALILLPVAGYAAIIDITKGQTLHFREHQLRLPRLPLRTPHVVLAVVLIYWLLRNIPYYPFSLLAPHVGRFG